VYCSLLLLILVIALFDFQSPWFETVVTGDVGGGNGTSSLVGETVGMVGRTVEGVVRGAVEGVKEKGLGGGQENGKAGVKEWRIPCLDVLVRF
jgi:hypothetical protein